VPNARKVAALGLLLGVVGSGGAAANSVDCQKRPTQVDRLVCGSQPLLNLDTAYAQAYRAAKHSAEDPGQFMKLAQSDLRWRAENCSDAGCIEEWYRNVTPRYTAMAANARAYGPNNRATRSTGSVADQVEAGVPRVSALAMSELYSQNSIDADARYLGKDLLITAQVFEVSRDSSGDPYVLVSGGYYGKDMIFMFSKGQQDILVPLRRWMTITFKCKMKGDHGAYLVADCRGAL
jgi:uncharacterized protein